MLKKRCSYIRIEGRTIQQLPAVVYFRRCTRDENHTQSHKWGIWQQRSLDMPRRFDIKALLKNPKTRKRMLDGAVDFICKVEGIRK